MKKLVFSIMIFFIFFSFFYPSSGFAFKIKNEKLKEIVSRVMKGDESPLSETEVAETLKEYESFLDQFDIHNIQQAAALIHLGHLIMALEENEEQDTEKDDKLPSRHPKSHIFSIGIYEKIRSNSSYHSPDDELLYQLAHGYNESGQEEKSLSLLKELATRFPKSNYYAEARFRIGESFFSEGKYPEASESYMKGLESNSSRPLMDFISYKLIWSFFKMGDYRKSVDMIMTVLNRYSVRQKNGISVLDIESLSEPNWKQVKELLHLATISIDFWGGAEKARSYFDFHGHVSYENLIYRPLGHLYLNRGKFQEAAQTFNTFLSLYPTHEEAPQFQMDLIETFQKAEKWDLAREARTTLIEKYRPETPWWKANSKTAQEKTALLRKDLLFQQAQSFHGEAQKSKKREDYLNAIASYQKFLSDFSKDMEAPRIEYFLGEAYFETEQFEQAASAYEISAYQYPLHLYSQEAGFAALISYEKGTLKSPNGSDSLRLTLLKSCQTFLKTFPDSPKKEAVLYKALSLALQTGNSGDGKVYAQQIFQSPLNKISPEMIVQTHYLLAKSSFDSRDYNSAEIEFKQALAWSKRADYHDSNGTLQKELNTFLALIQYKRAETLKNELKWKEAGSAFYHLYEEYPESELAPVSLINSGSAFLEAKDNDSALKSFNTISEYYPQSLYFLEAKTAATSLYEKKGDWNNAANGYEVLISLTSDPDKKNNFSDKLYSLYYKDSNWVKLYQVLNPVLKDHSLNNVKWLYYYAISAKELKNESEILLAVERSLFLKNQNRLGGSDKDEWVMKSLLLKGDILYRNFVSTTLASPLQKSLPIKKEKLKEALDTFTLAAQSSNPEIASEALYHIGNLFEQFANDLSLSERPKDLTPEQSEIYEGLLKNQVAPYFKKAIEVYQKNLAFSNQIENDWLRRSEARYRQLILENKGSSS